MKNLVDERNEYNILVVYNKDGNVGKTWLLGYMCDVMDNVVDKSATPRNPFMWMKTCARWYLKGGEEPFVWT